MRKPSLADPQHAGSVEELVKNANIAMHRAKARGRNRLQVFSEQMST